MTAATAVSAQVTAVNNGYHEWSTAEWTAGAPMGDATAFLNDNSSVSVTDGSAISTRGIRIGNVTSSTAMLILEEGRMDLSYIVLGNSPDSNAAFFQSGGSLSIADTQYIDFDLGSSEAPATSPCTAQAVFEAGTATLGDLRFNLSNQRSNTLTIDGSHAEVSATTLTGVPKESAWQKATLEFDFDRRGIAPIRLSGGLILGEKNQFVLKIDGSDYKGRESRFSLIESSFISGAFAEIIIEGFEGGASVYAEGSNIVLTIP
jgi:hypothetical protein